MTKLGDDDFMIFGSGMDGTLPPALLQCGSAAEGTQPYSMTERLCAFNIAGPKSRELLMRRDERRPLNESFPFMRSRRMPSPASRSSHCASPSPAISAGNSTADADRQVALYDALLKAGADLGAGPVAHAHSPRCASKRAMAAGAASIRPNTGRRNALSTADQAR